MILGAQILHINEGKGKLALLKTEDNVLLTYPSCSSFSSFVLFSLLLHISIVFPPRHNNHHLHISIAFPPPPPQPKTITSPLLSSSTTTTFLLLFFLHLHNTTTSTFLLFSLLHHHHHPYHMYFAFVWPKRLNSNNLSGRKIVRGVKTIEMWRGWWWCWWWRRKNNRNVVVVVVVEEEKQ